MKLNKYVSVLCILILLAACLTVPTLAAGTGDVAAVIEETWQDAAKQVKTMVNNVVFPVVSLVLAVLFFVKLATSYMEYKKHGSFEFTGPAILFFGLVLSLTAPLYLWTILGI